MNSSVQSEKPLKADRPGKNIIANPTVTTRVPYQQPQQLVTDARSSIEEKSTKQPSAQCESEAPQSYEAQIRPQYQHPNNETRTSNAPATRPPDLPRLTVGNSNTSGAIPYPAPHWQTTEIVHAANNDPSANLPSFVSPITSRHPVDYPQIQSEFVMVVPGIGCNSNQTGKRRILQIN
ncbi:hypothetical protein AJ79_09959 [Helicocarpus griseus UAMH5409]|uniref:Uncharacterized protein n=1 Tax=Helicocarpus griseus UAMH5409 TaxID=1447875 RepID=A0A2B7WGK2_9EURO|nr:hypothetical protein AJ79_09959 [Helicocarpus griseus UAMH5409]